MKLDKEQYEHLLMKQSFVRRLGDALASSERTGVTKVDLQVFEHKKEEWVQEYLVVTFFGGAISVRSANINSDSANFREIGNLIDGGFYSEVKGYREMAASEDWEQIM